MSDDLRERVARAIAYSGDIREKREWSELLPETRSHYRKQADAALAEIGGGSVREAARVLLDAVRIEPVHDAIQRSVRPAAFCAALRAIAEGKDDE